MKEVRVRPADWVVKAATVTAETHSPCGSLEPSTN